MSVDALLSRLDARPNGRDRWRCACPVCGERNRSTLSIGIGDAGGVLLKCFKDGCTADQIVHALGLELSDLFPPRRGFPGEGSWGQPRRGKYGKDGRHRRLLSASQALALLDTEVTFLAVVSSDMARGVELDDATRDRLMQCAARIGVLRDEEREHLVPDEVAA